MKILCYYNNVLERNTFTGQKSKNNYNIRKEIPVQW